MHIYIATYYGSSPLRRKLTEEFCARYPWAHLLTTEQINCENTTHYKIDQVGRIHFIMINKFLKTVDPEDWVTLIDADLNLPDNFREINESSCADFTHGFENALEKIDGKLYDVGAKTFYKDGRGHSGYVYKWSPKFLKLINWEFPEYFYLGGYDYVQALILYKKDIRCLDFLKKTDIYERVVEYFWLIKDCTYDYLPIVISHNYHGNKSIRLTPFADYAGLNCEKISKFFDKVRLNEKDNIDDKHVQK